MQTTRVTVPVLGLAAAVLAVACLTAIGARHRGLAVAPAALAGLLFPITWAVWYVGDEQPWGQGPRQATGQPRQG